jgi:2-polyprenyl-3-methyl-5-hydroxy-6-metoxy-1,4-benzoquinol methylase
MTLDRARADAFAEEMLSTLNRGALCLMLSVGHRTGLFDTMSGMEPATSREIATRAGLNERYVREWLGAMTTAHVIELDPATSRFRLPAEHAASLTRTEGADNLSAFAQYTAVLGGVEDDIIECFRKGGGVPYSRFARFQEVMAEDSGHAVVSALESRILPLIPGLEARLQSGIRALDVGCGRGQVLHALARLFPRSRFVGIDLLEDAVRWAREEAKVAGLANVEFVAADLSDFDRSAEPDSFDFITAFDAIHDQARPMNVLRGIHRALRPDGVYLMQDINGTGHLDRDIEHPIGTFLYTISCMHCMTVSLAQGGEGLGAMWGEEKTRAYLKEAGFGPVVTHRLPHDMQNNWYVVTKDAP